MQGKYIHLSAGVDGVPRRNGLDPVNESAVSTLVTYFNVNINNS